MNVETATGLGYTPRYKGGMTAIYSDELHDSLANGELGPPRDEDYRGFQAGVVARFCGVQLG